MKMPRPGLYAIEDGSDGPHSTGCGGVHQCGLKETQEHLFPGVSPAPHLCRGTAGITEAAW